MACESQGLKTIFKCSVTLAIMNMHFLYICNFVKHVETRVELKGNHAEVYEHDVNCYVELRASLLKLFLRILP